MAVVQKDGRLNSLALVDAIHPGRAAAKWGGYAARVWVGIVTQVPESGAPVPGLFAARFRAGNLPGNYLVKFELIGSNSFEYTVQVTEQ